MTSIFSAYQSVRHRDNLLGSAVAAISFSQCGSYLSISDSNGTIVLVHIKRGHVVYILQLSPLVQAVAMAWTKEEELFMALSDGVVASCRVSLTGSTVSRTGVRPSLSITPDVCFGQYSCKISDWIPVFFPSLVTNLACNQSGDKVAIGFKNEIEIWQRRHRSSFPFTDFPTTH